MRLCTLCHERPAAVPDRDFQGVGHPIKRICRHCHGKRLLGDLERIEAAARERHARLRAAGMPIFQTEGAEE